MDNQEIAQALYDLADTMEVGREATFKVRAFREAARAIEGLAAPAEVLLARGELSKVRGIGAGVLRRVTELCERGDLTELEERRNRLPPGLRGIVSIPGVGLRTAELLWRELSIDSVDELEVAAASGRLAGLPRFGKKREQKLIDAIAHYRERQSLPRRFVLRRAEAMAAPLVTALRSDPRVVRIDLAGSLRRRAETVGDIDILVAADAADAPGLSERFASLPGVAEVIARGDTKTSVVLREGIQIDLRIVPLESFGAALQYFTGSKEHNVALRARAVARGLKVSEYGVFDAEDRRVAGDSEAGVYASLELSYIEPELRENRGEIEASAAGSLPRLLERAAIRGDLHMHTVESDGRSTLAEMAEAARQRDLDYIAITEHSQSLTLARGLDPERLRAQMRAIDELNDELGGSPRVLRGIEVDILADGELDLDRDLLRELDWVVASVHTQFGIDRGAQTARVVKALESGVVDCLGHPTGRMLGKRDEYPIDLEEVLAAAKRVGAAVELNSSPLRLDLTEHALALARDVGVDVIVSSDAHHISQLDYLHFGVGIARRAWLEPRHVANTMSLHDMLARFGHHHHRR
jgi:DNA polymerase (family X)